jgi:hypothetical protein
MHLLVVRTELMGRGRGRDLVVLGRHVVGWSPDERRRGDA